MKPEIKKEAIEQLEKDILFGFESEEEIFEGICDLFYDEELDENWLKKEINERFEKHQRLSLTWEKPTDFDKLVKTFDQLNKEKIVALHNAGFTKQDGRDDCLEVIDELKAIGIQAKGYCFYHSQDIERVLINKNLFIGFDSYNQDDELAKQVAEKIVEVLKTNGFIVKWNRSIETRIEIQNVVWQKAYDTIEYNYDRVFRILENTKKPNLNLNKKKPFWKFW